MHQIRYFLAVSETLNLTKAAERCNVAQPALTRAIKALENELGGELLRRERAFSHLTDLGQRLLPMLRQCLDSALAAKVAAAAIGKGDVTPLSLAVSQSVSLHLFTSILRELSRAFPGLELKLHRGSGEEVVELLRSGAAELAIAGSLDEDRSRLHRLMLFEEPFVLVVGRSHRLKGKNRVALGDLAPERLMINAAGEMIEEIRNRLEANGIVNNVRHEVVSHEDLLALVRAGLGVAIMPVGAAKAGGAHFMLLEQLDLSRKVWVYGVAGRHRAVAYATFFNMLRAADWDAEAQ